MYDNYSVLVKFVSLYLAVPPAMPICKLQGKPELKANVTLTCLSSSGKPAPKYKWSKTSPTSVFFFYPMLSKFFIQIRSSLFARTLHASGTDCSVMTNWRKYTENALSLTSMNKIERSPRNCMNMFFSFRWGYRHTEAEWPEYPHVREVWVHSLQLRRRRQVLHQPGGHPPYVLLVSFCPVHFTFSPNLTLVADN